MNKINLTLETKTSKTGNKYSALFADLGYCKRALCFDSNLLCELFDCPPSVLKTLPVGSCISVGYLSSEFKPNSDK